MRIFASAAAVSALLLALPVRAQGAPPAPGGLTVRGSATVEQAPDTADLTISVITRAPTLEDAIQAHKAHIAQARAALERLKAEGATVDVASFDLTEERAPMQPGSRPPDTPPTYRADTRYVVQSHDLGGLDALATAIASTGLFEFDGARFSVRDRGAADDRAPRGFRGRAPPGGPLRRRGRAAARRGRADRRRRRCRSRRRLRHAAQGVSSRHRRPPAAEDDPVRRRRRRDVAHRAAVSFRAGGPCPPAA